MGNQETDLNLPAAHAARAVEVTCENCGAGVSWKPGLQALACEHCGTQREVKRLPGEILEYTLAEGEKLREAGSEAAQGAATLTLGCENCGARVQLLGRELSTHCVFCGSGQVVPTESLRRAIQPESVLPLMLPRERVAKIFEKWLRGLWFRPSALQRLKGFDARGIYVPAWTFDAQADSDWTAQAGYYYYVTETYTVQVNGRSQIRSRQVRKVRWESAAGQRRDAFDDLQVLASKGIDGELAMELGPFATGALLPYRAEYLIGWEAEEYAIGLEEGWDRGRDRMLEEQVRRCSRDVPGDTQRALSVQTKLSGVRWKHVLLPMWSLSYRFRGKSYAVLVHGQSGRVVGKAPLSWPKIVGVVLLVSVAVFAAFTLMQR